MLPARGIEEFRKALYSSPPRDELQVTPRRRLFKSTTGLAAAAAVINFGSIVSLVDTLNPGDAILIDGCIGNFSGNQAPTNPGLTLADCSLQLGDVSTNFFWQIGSPSRTMPITPLPNRAGWATSVPIVFDTPGTPSGASLWTSRDLKFVISQGNPTDLAAADQPLKFILLATFINNSAAAETCAIDLLMFYRLVRGLQEG